MQQNNNLSSSANTAVNIVMIDTIKELYKLHKDEQMCPKQTSKKVLLVDNYLTLW